MYTQTDTNKHISTHIDTSTHEHRHIHIYQQTYTDSFVHIVHAQNIPTNTHPHRHTHTDMHTMHIYTHAHRFKCTKLYTNKQHNHISARTDTPTHTIQACTIHLLCSPWPCRLSFHGPSEEGTMPSGMPEAEGLSGTVLQGWAHQQGRDDCLLPPCQGPAVLQDGSRLHSQLPGDDLSQAHLLRALCGIRKSVFPLLVRGGIEGTLDK